MGQIEDVLKLSFVEVCKQYGFATEDGFQILKDEFNRRVDNNYDNFIMAVCIEEAFEDQRSGETLSILTKARADCEKFISYVINVVFGIVVSVVFVSIYATRLHWSIIPIYIGGASMIAYVTNLLSKKIKVIQKTIVKELEEVALPNGLIIFETAQKQFINGDINYLEWAMLVNQSISIKSDYQDAILRLNESAINLSYLLNDF